MNNKWIFFLLSMTAVGAGIIPITVTNASPRPNAAILAQTGTVGQIVPNRTVRMVVLNATPVALFAGISGGARVELPQGASTAFAFDSTPINVFVYPAGREIGLKYNTTVQGNTVTVQVTQAVGDTPGNGAINISRSGSISIY
ncbi:MAG TPA: hypothetical protein V6C64_00045 [Microcoleaceae cyanobacterium]|jgi:hypothetical protein